MKTGLELHLRGRKAFDCEIFERSSGKMEIMTKQGYLSPESSSEVAVVFVPSADKVKHTFPILDPLGDGYAYEGSFSAMRGWRVRIEHLKPQ